MEKEKLLEKWSKKVSIGTDGFIRLIDIMGGDEAICQMARVSYGKGTKSVQEDEGLIRYLLRHRHTSPLESSEIKLHIRVPIDVMRQWIRHRTASINEYSTRYSEAIDSQNSTFPDQWRLQSQNNKQGSLGILDRTDGQVYTDAEDLLYHSAKDLYNSLLKQGVAREVARKVLPLSTYTEAYWKIDLHNLLHFLSLRMDTHAQQEIREYACVIGDIVSDWCPLTWKAFQDYQLNACTFSAQEMSIIRWLLLEKVSEWSLDPQERARALESIPTKRERIEFLEKIKIKDTDYEEASG